jgi:hypothetical protein
MTVPPFTVRLRFVAGVGTFQWDLRGSQTESVDGGWSAPIGPSPEQVEVCLGFGISRSAVFTNQAPKRGGYPMGGNAEVEFTALGRTWISPIELQAAEPWSLYAWDGGVGTGPEWLGAMAL